MQVKKCPDDGWAGRLRGVGLRATRHRLLVVRLLESARRPVTHAELFERCEAGRVDRTTVFRNLRSLVRARLVFRVDDGDHVWRYSLLDRPRPEARFECQRCGDVRVLPSVTINFSSRQVPPAVANWECDVRLVGLCGLCN